VVGAELGDVALVEVIAITHRGFLNSTFFSHWVFGPVTDR
jgi:hypothetical protein